MGIMDHLNSKKTTFFSGRVYDSTSGSPFDRGSADFYYGRRRSPNKGGVGSSFGMETSDLTAEEIAAYNAGYDFAESLGDRKIYG